MYTQCRGCGEIFAVAVDDIVTARAMVRCSSCGSVFNSLHTLSEYKPSENSDLILHEDDNPPPLLTHEYKQSIVSEKIETQQIESGNGSIQQELEEIDDATLFSVQPDFVAQKEPKQVNTTSWLWAFLTIGLMALLLWQTNESLKNGSLQIPKGKFRDTVCSYTDCYNGIKSSKLNNIALVSRSIKQHPGRDNALIITTGIINSDEKIQAFPALQVKMSNLNGEIVAMRRFLPTEYITDEDIINTGMLPNTLIPVSLELQSPGSNAVTFEVGFSNTHGSK